MDDENIDTLCDRLDDLIIDFSDNIVEEFTDYEEEIAQNNEEDDEQTKTNHNMITGLIILEDNVVKFSLLQDKGSTIQLTLSDNMSGKEATLEVLAAILATGIVGDIQEGEEDKDSVLAMDNLQDIANKTLGDILPGLRPIP